MAVKKGSHRRLVIILTIVVIGMFGFGYAMVPLYNVLCNVLNINGKTGGPAIASQSGPDLSRTITVRFTATLNNHLAWTFRPEQKLIKIHPGVNYRVAYFAQNNTAHSMTVQAVPSVAPANARTYLKKTECFCFNQQTLASGESLDMPILFHIDRDLPKDVKSITLSYTLFDASHLQRQTTATTGRIN